MQFEWLRPILIIFAAMKRRAIYCAVGVLLAAACARPAGQKTQEEGEFSREVLLKMTPVKDQGHSALCWLYGMTATIETEHLMKGDSVHLSVDYLARRFLHDAAVGYYFSGGRVPVSMRGMGTMTLRLMDEYGAEPYDSYHGKGVSYDVISRRLMQAAGGVRSLESLNARIEEIFDHAVDYLPRIVYMLGAEYTPLEFAHSMAAPGEYTALTSFTHHPFGRFVALEVPDNRMHDRFLNLPLDSLMAVITRSLSTGHPVCWEGDVSEPGFSFKDGVARMPAGAGPVTQRRRQQAFERLQTTDDHVMALVGLARDRKGRRYFIAKNSWGTRNPYGGLMYLSDDYVRMKTVAVIVQSSLIRRADKLRHAECGMLRDE